MKNLAKQQNVFKAEFDEELVSEYFTRNERKKEDEKWLKANRNVIVKYLQDAGKDSTYVGAFKVSVVVPNTSKFIPEKVLKYVQDNNIKKALKETVDMDVLSEMVDQGEIDLEELQEVAWESSVGTPRLTISAREE